LIFTRPSGTAAASRRHGDYRMEGLGLPRASGIAELHGVVVLPQICGSCETRLLFGGPVLIPCLFRRKWKLKPNDTLAQRLQKTPLKRLILFFWIAFATPPVAAQSAMEGAANNSCTIEYQHLATQKSDPFLFLGVVMTPEHPRWSQFRWAIWKYPDARSCLTSEEAKSENPNLLQIDWARVGTGAGEEVCAFRIFSSLGSVDLIETWLSYHEFRYSDQYRIGSKKFNPRYASQPVSQIMGWWSVEKYRAINPSLFSTITGVEFVSSYQMVVSFDQLDRVSGVGTYTPI